MAVEVRCDVKGLGEFQAAIRNFGTALQKHVHRELASWAAYVKTLVRQLVPVRTGHLRSTIYAKVSECVVEIGAEAAYALFVEFGTRYMKARPYLYPAVQQHLPRLEQIIVDALIAAEAEAGL